MDPVTQRIILASSSPRRKMLLKQLEIPFDIIVSDIDEQFNHALSPAEIAEDLALQKAQAVAATLTDAIVIGADTIVVHDDAILGKPNNEQDAFQMLSRLSGEVHQVMTGLTLISTAAPTTTLIRHETTQVKIAPLSEADIHWYIATGEPLDKAGAYGIQGKGAIFVKWIHGCYNNVVGLPLFLLITMFEEITGRRELPFLPRPSS
ncbi:septum formation inhibitor Maf [candidate division KSB3 bacterium]|uniref:dTTP/UTP pyrophosphatase n=1 Tax=candidate division KSB3 bacterium TaxID=2044937 RepID=A0A2G6KBW5_9BACT|nr:MAG: septum formation inhibitor Maf [candidate division KSB3 bacterium]